MDKPSHYRAKLQFQTRSFKDQVKAGLYAENSHRLIGITNCYVQDAETQEIINGIAKLLTKHRIPIYNERKQHGIRTVMVRKARKTGQVQVIFITSCQVNLTKLIDELTSQFPSIITIALNWNRQKTSDIYGKNRNFMGEQAIDEAVLDYEFSLSPRAFYQLNPQQTEILYGEVKALDISGDENLIDAYCGVGTISFAFAKRSNLFEVWTLFQKPSRMLKQTLSEWDYPIPTMQVKQKKSFQSGTKKATGPMPW